MQAAQAGGSRAKVLIADDDSNVRKLAARILAAEDCDVREACDGAEAYTLANAFLPDVILLDVMMPGMDGFAAAAKLKHDTRTRDIPIIMVTALDDRDSRVRALAMGAEEFLNKPFEASELRLRVRNLIRLKQASDLLKEYNQGLEEKVKQRTRQWENALKESVYTLVRAAEYRDDETGAHVQRISHYAKAIAENLGMDSEFCETIFFASPLHDIGKIGIPDRILLKPGKLTPEEWKIMKSHTTLGAAILARRESPFLKMGYDIALNHHERWDGSGYPHAHAGEDIPLPARIMQICDVYDALRSIRPYKNTLDHATSMEIITKGDGRTSPAHFDPQVLSAFIHCQGEIEDIFATLTDET